MRKVRLEYVHVRICGPRDNKGLVGTFSCLVCIFSEPPSATRVKGHVGTIAKKLTIFTGQNLQLLSADTVGMSVAYIPSSAFGYGRTTRCPR